ncbi:hypothetical protein RJ641_025641 [Dillenia turbinata]|uniref:Hydroxyproline-rich glycoprotein family protein n=1 Tax=Dillenia turbinata TaxID=194707 RepID=A0AAN8W7C9_9MAGN
MHRRDNPNPFLEEQKRWGKCWGGLSCFGSQKGSKRIVPAIRIPEGNASGNQPNGHQATGLANQPTTLAPSILAPPSSPASFTNSALPSTVQSPSCFLSMSANSPEGHSSTMFATGPYAHETQLVSPPVFSTFTTEPSTAPLTPPPELAHLTTPSSPDVPFAHFLSSSVGLKGTGKSNYLATKDLHTTYSLSPGSPASSLRSPVSRASGECLSSSFAEQESPRQWDPSQNAKYPKTESAKLFELDTERGNMSQDSNFFCPATFAQFYLDHTQKSYPPFPLSAGRLSISRESDGFSTGGNGQQNRHNKNCKQDVEEIEAYRASFGFSADEIIATPQYVEISDVNEDSFTMMPFPKPQMEEIPEPVVVNDGQKTQEPQLNMFGQKCLKSESYHFDVGLHCEVPGSCNGFGDHISQKQPKNISEPNTRPLKHMWAPEEEIFLKMEASGWKCHMGLSSSDAEIDYRRGRSLREKGRGDFVWHG